MQSLKICTPFGLGGSVWSSDIQKAKALAMKLECGTAWVNTHAAIQPNAPFGGVKQSGFGVEFAREGLTLSNAGLFGTF